MRITRRVSRRRHQRLRGSHHHLPGAGAPPRGRAGPAPPRPRPRPPRPEPGGAGPKEAEGPPGSPVLVPEALEGAEVVELHSDARLEGTLRAVGRNRDG